MSKFDRYRGLLAEQGDFDIPGTIQAGVAFDVMPNLTLMADYKRIWFSSIAPVGNPSTNFPAPVRRRQRPGLRRAGRRCHQARRSSGAARPS